MIQIGRLCVKLTGREANKKCVIVDIIDPNFVLIDGQVRRRKCNVKHIEFLPQVLSIEKGDSHEHVVSELKKAGIEMVKTKPKQKADRPRKSHGTAKGDDKKPTKEKKPAAAAPKKEKAAAPKVPKGPAKKSEEA